MQEKKSITLLDNIYTNVSNCYQLGKSGVLKSYITDHFPIFRILENVSTSKNQAEIYLKGIFLNLEKFNENK